MNFIRYECKAHKACEISWIPESLNIANILTMKDSALSDALVMWLFTGMLKFEFCPELETTCYTKNLGWRRD